ncbi:uncharacterized protein LOC120536476 isoform X2 [Polypterus senegalus]|nr:uncharacterized protein LOC120536476 isoform X2 [Polypterus senegalus]XP_039620785.1 uncharacterized protein LOC120536476 isoform X2 [Polypterus senegalus]
MKGAQESARVPPVIRVKPESPTDVPCQTKGRCTPARRCSAWRRGQCAFRGCGDLCERSLFCSCLRFPALFRHGTPDEDDLPDLGVRTAVSQLSSLWWGQAVVTTNRRPDSLFFFSSSTSVSSSSSSEFLRPSLLDDKRITSRASGPAVAAALDRLVQLHLSSERSQKQCSSCGWRGQCHAGALCRTNGARVMRGDGRLSGFLYNPACVLCDLLLSPSPHSSACD